ncbi:MAG: MaoC/PaaZ C-terminal domain-containing protein [Myxococcota bacterium]
MSQIKVGDLIAPLLKSAITRVQISQFAAATGDFNPMHVDDTIARSNGYSGICAHPQLALAYVEQALLHHLPDFQISKMTATFQKLIWPGDMLTAKGVVSKEYEQDGQNNYEIDIWVENQNHDVILKGTVTGTLSSHA